MNKDKLKTMCQRLDKPFYTDDLDSAFLQSRKEHSYLSDDEVQKNGREIIGLYFKNINTLRQNKDKCFSDSEKDNFTHKTTNCGIKARKKGITPGYTGVAVDGASKGTPSKKQNTKTRWTEQDKQNKQYAVDVIGYDPFEEYPEEGRKFLFNQLSPYLEDDSNADDAYKLSQILQIIKNNYQIYFLKNKVNSSVNIA